MMVLIITKYLIKGSLNRKKSLLIYILLPIICLLVPILILNNTNKINSKINLTIVDMDNSKASTNLINVFKEKYDFHISKSDLAKGKQDLISDRTSSIIVIPDNFQEDLVNNKGPKLEIIYLRSSEEVASIKNILNSYIVNLNLLTATNSLNSYEIFSSNISMVNFNESDNQGYNMLQSSLGLMILFMIILISTSFAGFLIDKNNNNLKRVITTGLTGSHYLVSYIIWSSIICLFQCSVLIFLLSFFKITFGISYIFLFFILTLISIMAISFGALSISFCKSEDEITVLNAVIVFPTSMLSGCLWPINLMSKNLQNLSLLFPQRHIFILMGLLQSEDRVESVIVESALILLICILFITISFIRINSKGWSSNL